MSLSGNIKVLANFAQTKTADFEAASSIIALAQTLSFSDGVAAGNADRIWKDTRTLGISANEDLDLSGTLTDIYGAAVVFADVRAILIVAAATNTNNVRLIRPASNGLPIFLAASDGIDVRPGGVFLWMCSDATAVPVTAGTGDLINIANSGAGTTIDYSILVVGASS